jgi:PilZ domain
VPSSAQTKSFRPGDLAPITGIYRVTHGLRHRDAHEVVIIRGEQLPPCRTCKVETIFQIVRTLSHVTHDWDFSGPDNLVIRPRHDAFHDFRMFRRIHLQLPVSIEFPASPVTVHGHSSDLSAGGLGAIIRTKLPSEAKTGTVRIGPSGGQKELAFPAQLRYHSGLRYGFEFTNVSAANRQSIRRLIENRKRRAADVAG